MTANLFSTFDQSTNMSLSLNWISVFMGLLLVPPTYWLIPSRINMFWIKLMMTLHNEFKTLIKTNESNPLVASLFTLILFNNLLGLFPYIFTCTTFKYNSIPKTSIMNNFYIIWLNKKYYSHICPLSTSSSPKNSTSIPRNHWNYKKYYSTSNISSTINSQYNCSTLISNSFSKFRPFFKKMPPWHFNYHSNTSLNFSVSSSYYSILCIFDFSYPMLESS